MSKTNLPNVKLNNFEQLQRWQWQRYEESTTVCNNIDKSIHNIPPVSIVDTPQCNNNSSSIQGIPSPNSNTVSPQQTHVTLKSLKKSFKKSLKEFLLNEICVWQKKVYTNKDRMEQLKSSLQDKPS